MTRPTESFASVCHWHSEEMQWSPTAARCFNRADGETLPEGRKSIGLDRCRTWNENASMEVGIRILLAFALLACPMNCMGVLSAPDEPSVSSSGCGCCPHHQAEHDSDRLPIPHSPDDDCQCPTCLCNGAVLLSDHTASVLVAVSLQDLAEVWIGDLTSASATTSSRCIAWRSDQRPLHPAGRAARILQQSFLL